MPVGKPAYVFGRGFLSSARLNLLHFFLKEHFGYLLHPKIPSLRAGQRVTDLGCGTGIWLTDLARRYPATKFHGTDISLSQAPPNDWKAPNIEFEMMDILKPPPEHLVEAFDVVNVRFMVCIVTEPKTFLQNALKLLKPGGWFQWTDPAWETRKFEKTNPNFSYEKTREASYFMTTRERSEDARCGTMWAGKLPDIFSEGGLESVVEDKRLIDHNMLTFFHDHSLMTWMELSQQMRPEKAAEFQQIISDAEQEVMEARRGVALNWAPVLTAGRKPLRR